MIRRKETIIIDNIIKYLNENIGVAIIIGAILTPIVGYFLVKISRPTARIARQAYNGTISYTRNQWKNLKINLHKKASMNREETLQILEEIIEITSKQKDLNTEILRILNKTLKKQIEPYDRLISRDYKINIDYHHELREIIIKNKEAHEKQDEIERKIEELNEKIQ